MEWWWALVIVAGIIFIFTVLVLIWIIVACNEIVKQKKEVDKNYPLMSSKIKEYLIEAEKAIKFVVEKTEEESKEIEQAKKCLQKTKETDGVSGRVHMQAELEKKIVALLKYAKQFKQVKSGRKFASYEKQLQEISEGIVSIKARYNEATTKYNTTISHFPTRMLAERFKFFKVKLWE